MKNVCLKIIICLICITSFHSCKTELEGKNLGTSIHYDDFLWETYTPDTIFQTISIEADFDEPVTLGLFEKETCMPVGEKIQLYSNGEFCTHNQITINPGDTQINLAFVYTTDESSKDQWYFCVVNPGDLDRINSKVAKNGLPLPEMTMKAERKHIANPLAKIVMWIGIILGALIILWFAVLRRLFISSFSITNMQVIYYNGDDKLANESITIKKARKIICSSSTQKQSLINRIFLGRIEYLENSFWTTTVEMTPFGDQIFIKEVINSSAKSTTNNTYRIGGNISSINGPKNPLVIKHNNSQMTAKVIVGG